MSMVRNYAIVTASYWGFTLVDGALRMLVLLHFFQLGYSPFTLAFLFLLYETAGIFANLAAAGWRRASAFPRMLAVGQALQIAGLIMLSLLQPGWSAAASVIWVVIAQGIAGVAKDVTKTASKSAIKATSTEGSGQLFRWVAWFTGSKNAMKGIGFFVGGLLLDVAGFQVGLWLMAALLGVIFVAGLALASDRARQGQVFEERARTVRQIAGRQSACRRADFPVRGARRLVRGRAAGVPLRERLALPARSAASWRSGPLPMAASRRLAPSLVTRSADGLSREVPAARLWGGLLAALPLLLVLILQMPDVWRPDLVVVAGLLLFGIPFAVNSSLHSYLILAYAGSEKAAEDVGFYYAANATGRLAGILLSGALYQAGGIAACLIGSGVMLGICWLIVFMLPTSPDTVPAKERLA